MTTNLDHYLPADIRTQIEQKYYARINVQAQLDQLATNPDFLATPENHLAFYSDHGVVHARDVAQQLLRVLAAIHGVLIPARPWSQLSFMQGYGVMLAYLHDIGMVDFSCFGRTMHPEFAAQAVFKAEFDDLVQTIWDENYGNVPWRLLKLADRDTFAPAPQVVLRELLAMALCHSKSKIPMQVLNNPRRLRATMLMSVATELTELYQQQQIAQRKGSQTLSGENRLLNPPAWIGRHYQNFERDSFAWLVSKDSELRPLIQDVIDTLRVLRCADALRQRGTVLTTSGGYQIFVDAGTANAIHAFQKGANETLLLLETDDVIAAGEANIASSELTNDGDLRISFHRGAFGSPEAVQHAIQAAATVINDIQADVISSFQGVTAPKNSHQGLKQDSDMQILLEGVDDNPHFAMQVCQALITLNPHLRGRSRPVSSLQNMSQSERERYLQGADLDWSHAEKARVLRNIARSGHKVEGIDQDQAFENVRLISVEAGEVLIEAGSPPGFVYIPLSGGLKGIPLSGNCPFSVCPWTPLGNTSVIRGAVRNAIVVVEQPLRLLMIPKEVYLKTWHATYTKAEFRQIVGEIYGQRLSVRPRPKVA